MEVYLVRHGQTNGNIGHRHQHTSTHLNERGQAQARTVADTIAALNPTHLITSTHVRAMETARVIAGVTNLLPETYPAFEELHQSRSMVGERLVGVHALTYMLAWFVGVPAASRHDGEMYAAFVVRLAAARRHLEELPPDARVVIVSHSVFINFFVEHMVRPKRMNVVRAVVRLVHILTLKNTSITHVHYEKPASGYTGTGWHIVRGR
jgi:broad specificity phosphatase PhoE